MARFVLWTVVLVGALLLVLAVLLSVLGFPQPLKTRLLSRLNAGSFALIVDDARLSVFEGLVGKRCRIFRKEVLGPPFIESDEVVLACSLLDLVRRNPRPFSITVRNGKLRPYMVESLQAADEAFSRPVDLDIERATLGWDMAERGVLRINEMRARLRGLPLSGRGALVFAGRAMGPRRRELGARFARNVLRWARYLDRTRWGPEAEAEVTFLLDFVDQDRTDVHIRAQGRNGTYMELQVGTWRFDGDMKGLTLTGRASLEGCTLDRTRIPRLACLVRHDEHTTRIEEAECLVAREGRSGTLSGSFSYEHASQTFQAEAKTRCFPDVFLPFCRAERTPVAEFIADLLFAGAPPEADMHVSGRWEPDRYYAVNGYVKGSACGYRGVTNSSVNATFAAELSDETLRVQLDPIVAVRPEGKLEASFTQDFKAQTVDLASMVSTMNPKAVARMVGPYVEERLASFAFHGPVAFQAKGAVAYGAEGTTDFQLQGKAQDMGLLWFVADACSARLHLRGNTAEISDIQGSLYGGRFKGSALFTPDSGSTNFRYRIRGEMGEVDFMSVVSALKEEEVDLYEGLLSATLAVEGLWGEGQGPSAGGEGRVRIKDGRLFEIPLFGGLTGFLTKAIPGFRLLVEQTDASAKFTIRDGKLHASNARVEGAVLNVAGDGTYAFDERLDFDIRIQLLKEYTLVGKVMKWVTLPVSKLLEFDLGGTLKAPHWSPAIMPGKPKPEKPDKPEKPEKPDDVPPAPADP